MMRRSSSALIQIQWRRSCIAPSATAHADPSNFRCKKYFRLQGTRMDTVRGSIDRPPRTYRISVSKRSVPYRIRIPVSQRGRRPKNKWSPFHECVGFAFCRRYFRVFLGATGVAPLGCKAVDSSGYIFSVDRNCSGRATTGLHDDSRGADLRRKGLRGCQRDVGRSARVADTVRGRASTLP